MPANNILIHANNIIIHANSMVMNTSPWFDSQNEAKYHNEKTYHSMLQKTEIYLKIFLHNIDLQKPTERKVWSYGVENEYIYLCKQSPFLTVINKLLLLIRFSDMLEP